MTFMLMLHYTALFIGYCAMTCGAILLIGAVIGYVKKQSGKGKER